MAAKISVVAGDQHVVIYLPDDTYVQVEPHNQHSVNLDGAGLLAVNQMGEAEEPPTGNDVKAFFIKIFQAVIDRIQNDG